MTLTVETDTVTAALARAVEREPDRVYLDFAGDSHTYAEFDRHVNRLAHGLIARGVTPGDTVVTMLDNHVDAVAAWYAINRAGAISVPINTALKGEFLRHVVADAAARIVMVEAGHVDRFHAIAEGIPAVDTLVQRGENGPRSTDGLDALSFDDLLSEEASSLPDRNQPGDLTCLIYTAGTTGPSKGCMISHNYAANLARHGLRSNARTVDEIVWSPLPLFHLNATATKILATAILGGTVSIYPRFSVSNFWGEIRRSGASIASLLGAMIPLIAQAPDSEDSLACFGQLRHVSGAPFPPELQDIWRSRFGVKTCGSNVYGLSEAAPVTSLPHGVEHPPGSSGRRNDDFEVRIVDDEGNELPDGEMGEVLVRARHPHVMFEGYWKRPDETAAVLDVDGWFHTGDYGRFDTDGFFWFMDRKKDYLRRRGENISSVELENAFRSHPAISEVAAHAVPSELTEDDVKITVVLADGAELGEEELCRWAFDHVPRYAFPRYIEFRESLPKNAVGRVLKYQLRDEGCTPTTWDREAAGLDVPRG